MPSSHHPPQAPSSSALSNPLKQAQKRLPLPPTTSRGTMRLEGSILVEPLSQR